MFFVKQKTAYDVRIRDWSPDVCSSEPSALEESGSATAATGWQPAPIAIDGPDGRPAAVMPAYAKSHRQGEYVFDHAWADRKCVGQGQRVSVRVDLGWSGSSIIKHNHINTRHTTTTEIAVQLSKS